VLGIRWLDFDCVLAFCLTVIPEENFTESSTSELGANLKLVFIANG
jgi:hypothetical protein